LERSYRADIDGLRAVAVTAVVAFHAFPGLAPGGFVGVDVFFVISGYLISGILLESLERGTFSFRGFYARRIRRIFPALLVVLAVFLAFGWFALTPDEYRRLARHSSAAAGFVLNFVLAREAGYFDVAAALKPLLHLWSLAIEEQFYIVWPLVLYLGWKRRRALPWAIGALFAISFAANVLLVGRRPESAFFLPLPRFWELLAGSLLAWAELRGRVTPSRTLANVLSAAGVVLLAAAFELLDGARAFPGWWALLPVAGTVLLLAAGARAWPNELLALRGPVAIGLVSYPLYLWHWPLLSLATMIGLGRVSLGMRLGLVTLSGLLAWATYALVEKPIRFGARGRPRLWDLRTAGCAAAMCGVAACALWVASQRGFPSRFPNTVAVTEHAREIRKDRVDPGCERFVAVPERAFDYCRYQPGTGGEIVAILGDSHGRSIFPGLAEKLAGQGIGTLLLASTLCPPLDGTTVGVTDDRRNECARQTEQELAVVEAKPEIRRVVISTRGPLYITGSGFGVVDQQQRPTRIVSLAVDAAGGEPPDSLVAFREGLRRTAQRLTRSGRQVSYLLEVPELGFQPVGCVERPHWIRPAQGCEVTRRDVDERQSAYRAMVRELESQAPGFTVLDPFPLLCDSLRCRAADGETLLYEDDDHLSIAGSRLLAARLF
jgi:peptidoglycan/LPS O-acetylase OafA/YrhL